MTEAEFNTGKKAFINMLTPKFSEERTYVVKEPPKAKILPDEPPNLQKKYNASPHSSPYSSYTGGTHFSSKYGYNN